VFPRNRLELVPPLGIESCDPLTVIDETANAP
jgi:hypothetical protein